MLQIFFPKQFQCCFFIFLLLNVPTAIFLGIYSVFQKKKSPSSQLDKMKIKEGDSIISGGHYGIVTKALPFDEFITIKTNDDEKEYSISRKYVDLAQVSEWEK